MFLKLKEVMVRVKRTPKPQRLPTLQNIVNRRSSYRAGIINNESFSFSSTYSAISWGFPLLMVGIAVAFKYKEKEIKTKLQLTAAEIVQELLISKHCW